MYRISSFLLIEFMTVQILTAPRHALNNIRENKTNYYDTF